MDNHEGGGSNFPGDYVEGGFSGINLSDVIEVIENNMVEENNGNMVNVNNADNKNHLQPYAEIIEQPAPKALRFRYECEGRSAGSIPGVTSTSDNKTFPTLQIRNYNGRAVVVVSCVTKDQPHKAHPHSIVGRDGCKKGVCTLEINSEDMKMVFSNLGIQCVKKRDIEEALKIREEIRVDPFRMGFNHKSQPSSIDLNSVRLCFQVFLEGPQRGKFTVPIKPVVSDPIFDKKSTSDLVITKVSHCSAFCNGGQEMILLCEKVTKDDIQVWFYEENGSWECQGEFAPSHVHKQVAISFRTPKYHRIDIIEGVKVKMQLRRPSDGAQSDPIEFEMLPLSEGRRGFWNIQRELKKRSASDDLFKLLQSADEQPKFKIENFDNVSSHSQSHVDEVVCLDTPVDDNAKRFCEEKASHWLEDAQFIIDSNNNNENDQNAMNHSEDDKTLNDILEQVAELDVIYEDHQVQRHELPTDVEMETFDDNATYSSLQKAFRHPIEFQDAPPLPPKQSHVNDGTFDLCLPPICINELDSGFIYEDFDDEKLPPLPPKRAKVKVFENDKENFGNNFDDTTSLPIMRHGSSRSLTPRPPQQIIIKSAEQKSPSKSPSHIAQKQKKPGFFSKMFSRRKSRIEDDGEVENSSLVSFQCDESAHSSPAKSPLKTKTGKPVGRSVSSVSGKRPHMGPDIINIPLKGDSTTSLPLHDHISKSHLSLPASELFEKASTASLHPLDRRTVSALQLADVPIKDGDMELVAIADAQSIRNLCEGGEFGIMLDPSVDLTEAEHYALYTTFAPHATLSEIDENSCYYAPIEYQSGEEILTPAEIARRLAENL